MNKIKVFIIGSTAYYEKMVEHKHKLEATGRYTVTLPVFDSEPDLNEVAICSRNVDAIRAADEVHIIWDGRSTGFLFDLGAAFALKKKLVLVYLNHKTLYNLVKQITVSYETEV